MTMTEHSSSIESSLLRRFYKDVPSALVGNAITATILAFVMWGRIPVNYLVMWLVSIYVILVFRFALYLQFQSGVSKSESFWRIAAIVSMGVTGLFWAVMPLMVMSYGTALDLTFLILVLSGITAGALSSSAAFRTAYILFVVPPIFVLFILLLSRGNSDYYTFAYLIPVFLVLLLRSNNEYHNTLRHSLVLRYSNNELMQKMEKINHELEIEIASQKAISSQLEESEVMFRSLAESSESIIMVYGENDTIYYLNPAAEKIMGFDTETIMEKPFAYFLHPEDREMIKIRAKKRLKGEDVPHHYQVRILDHETRTHWLDVSAAMISFQGQSAVIITAIDITHMKQTQEQLIKEKDRAENSNKAKSEFLATMSHEIRTPMNGVLGMTELLLNMKLDERARQLAKAVHNSAENLLIVINDILDFSKIDADKLELNDEDFNLRYLIEDVLELVSTEAHQKGLEVIANLPVDLPVWVMGDPVRIRQVLINLLGNAIKFTEQGEIKLSVAMTGESDKQRDYLFSISDTGIGIAREHQSQIFNVFQQADGSTTRRFGGTGLGLTICKRLVELMGGEIALESSPGQGAEFTFTVHFQKPDSPERVTSPPDILHHVRVLIVDDHVVNREILHNQVISWGLRNGSAASAEQALALLRAASIASDPYQIVLLDFNMPGMDGLVLARAIQSDAAIKSLHILLLSSGSMENTSAALDQAGISCCIQKPVRQKYLLNTLCELLGQQIRQNEFNPELKPDYKARILLAEDNLVNQEVALGLLMILGCEVDLASTGLQALELCQTKEYALIFMDCHMPHMDGFEASEAIRELEKTQQKQRTPIIALTADVNKGIYEQCLQAGMDAYISKPFSQKDLINCLSQWLGDPGVLSS